jgi:hypothetical protein
MRRNAKRRSPSLQKTSNPVWRTFESLLTQRSKQARNAMPLQTQSRGVKKAPARETTMVPSRDLWRGWRVTPASQAAKREPLPLSSLRNVGKATLADFHLLGIRAAPQLANQDADALYIRLCELTAQRHDPCVHDVFSAAIHQARTGEAVDWWAFTPTRKERQKLGRFPVPIIQGSSRPSKKG